MASTKAMTFTTAIKTRYPKDSPPYDVVCLMWKGVGIAAFEVCDTTEQQVAEYIRLHGYRAEWNMHWNLGRPVSWQHPTPC